MVINDIMTPSLSIPTLLTGFLKTGTKDSAQGNFGLMDLVAGLHWLRENLPAFNGDGNKITVMGHGTGAALANILVVSPVASGKICLLFWLQQQQHQDECGRRRRTHIFMTPHYSRAINFSVRSPI